MPLCPPPGQVLVEEFLEPLGLDAAELANHISVERDVVDALIATKAPVNAELSLRLARYFSASVELMQVLARACGHSSLSDFGPKDIATWKYEMSRLSGIRFAGVAAAGPPP